MAEEVLRFRILGDDSNFQRSMGNVNNTLQNTKSKIAGSIKGFAKVGTAVAAVGVAVGAGVLKFANMGAEVQEMQNKFDVVFKGVNKEAENWASTFATAVGRNKNTIKESMANFSDLTQGMGMAKDVSLDLSKNMITLATDLASFNNTTDSQAIEAMSAAMMGETEMAKALGLGLNESVMKTSEFTLATGKSWEELTRAERAQVYYKEAVKQSSNAIGDAERSSGSYTNQMKTLKSKLEEVGQAIGTAFLPALTPLVTKMSEMVSSLDMTKINEFINVGLLGLANAFNFLKPYIVEMVGVIKTLFSETQIGGQVIKFMAELWAIYGAQIIATVQLMLSTIVSNWKASVSILTSIWNIFGENIKSYIRGVVAAIIQIVTGLLNVLQGIFKLIASVLKGDWQAAWAAIKQIGKGAVDVVVGIVKAFFNQLKGLFGAGVTVIKGIWGKVKYALMSGIDAGVNYVIGKVNGMISKINSAISLINRIPGVKLPTVKNIPQTASKTLSQVYGHASGGILTKPTFSGNHLAGESGAEAIIPLTNKQYVKPFAQTIADMIGGSGGVTVNLYGMVVREEADITKIARQLQYEIDKKNRAKGVK
jgi:hypothetical protein